MSRSIPSPHATRRQRTVHAETQAHRVLLGDGRVAAHVLDERLASEPLSRSHRQQLVLLRDELDASAKRYESVNCVVKRNGKNIGYNTDCYGFLRALEAGGAKLDGKVLQIGCGGVGRMMAIESILHGADLTVIVLPGFEDTAEAVIAELKNNGCNDEALSRFHYIHNDEISGDFDLLVNATPVGMFPKVDNCPVSEEVITHCRCVFDAIYNPDKTKLMLTAEAHGIKALGGMAMLVWQAVVAHEIWSGAKYNDSDIARLIDDMRAALVK